MTPRILAVVLLSALLALPAPSTRAQTKDTLTVGLVWINDTLDPHMHYQRVGILINTNMFDSLLHQNTKHTHKPSLATPRKASNDTTWELKLTKGGRFHQGDQQQ